jgi:acyl-coenzyme A thioesterase PaaI-like protein
MPVASDQDLLALGRQVLASQPFSILLGAELAAFSEGHAEIRIPLRPEHQQQHGFAHGGVVSYAADNALTFAGASQTVCRCEVYVTGPGGEYHCAPAPGTIARLDTGRST